MLRHWRPIGEGEFIIACAVRRARTGAILRFSSNLLIGLSFGFLVAECVNWLQTARFGSPYTSEVYRALHIKLPRSEWAGMAQAIVWVLNQPLCLVAVTIFISASLLLRWLATIIHAPVRRPYRLPPKQILLLPTLPTVDPRFFQIEETYRRIDAVGKSTPSTPQQRAAE